MANENSVKKTEQYKNDPVLIWKVAQMNIIQLSQTANVKIVLHISV